MPKLLTTVPQGPPPPPRGAARHLLPVADLFMLVLLSRPPAGTLATTWVTTATLFLAAGCVVAPVALISALLAGLGHWPAGLIALTLAGSAAFALGAASVLAVGLGQHRHEP